MSSAMDTHLRHQGTELLEGAHLGHSHGARSHREDGGDLLAGETGDDTKFQEFAVAFAQPGNAWRTLSCSKSTSTFVVASGALSLKGSSAVGPGTSYGGGRR